MKPASPSARLLYAWGSEALIASLMCYIGVAGAEDHGGRVGRGAMEATHHEPNTAKLSATFVEVGGSEAQWGDEGALEALASAVADLASFKPSGAPVAMSAGDLHYSSLTDEVLRGEIDLGHVIR